MIVNRRLIYKSLLRKVVEEGAMLPLWFILTVSFVFYPFITLRYLKVTYKPVIKYKIKRLIS